MTKKNNIILIGFMGAGKTSVGKRLAAALDYTFLDTDEEIERREGRAINEIFAVEGEQYFRDQETEQLKLLLDGQEQLVISVGGGLPVREQNRILLHQLGTVIFLQGSIETLAQRLQGSHSRPMLAGYDLRERIGQLMQDRMEAYLDAADLCLKTDELSLKEVTRACVSAVEQQK